MREQINLIDYKRGSRLKAVQLLKPHDKGEFATPIAEIMVVLACICVAWIRRPGFGVRYIIPSGMGILRRSAACPSEMSLPQPPRQFLKTENE